MLWIKHMVMTRDDERVARLVADGGHAAYGLWWMVLETIAKRMDKSNRCSVKYPVSEWASKLHVAPQNLRRQLQPLLDSGLIVEVPADACPPPSAAAEASQDCSRRVTEASQRRNRRVAEIELQAPNLLKYRDEYSKRSGHATDKPAPTTTTETDTEEETTYVARRPVQKAPGTTNGNSHARPVEWPQTSRAIRHYFESADDAIIVRILDATIHEYADAAAGGECPPLNDKAVASAIHRSYFKKQESAGAFVRAVPRCIRTWVEEAACKTHSRQA